MRFSVRTSLLRRSFFVLAAVTLLWLALPRLIGFAVGHWLAVPGLEQVRVDIADIGAGRARLRELGAVYQTAGGHRLQVVVHSLVIDYSLARRHVDLLEADRAEVVIQPVKTLQASPWPQLAWPPLPLSELNVRDLRLSFQIPQRPPLRMQGSLMLQQGADGRLLAEFRPAADLLRLTVTPGAMLESRIDWLPAANPAASAVLRIGQQPALQPATLTAQGHLAALPDLGRALGVVLPVTGASGAVRLEAEATLGKFSGEVLALKGELEFLQAGFKAASDEARPLGVELTGKARLLWQHRGDKLLAGIELQPGLSWQVFTAGGQSLQASGHLDKAFAMHMGDGQAKSEAEFPFALSSPQWGRWEGAVKQLQFKPDPASGGIGEALAKLRIRGQVPSWQHGALYAQAIGSDGEVDLRWVRDAVSSASARLQVKAGRLQLAGKTALRVQNSTWTVLAEASLPPGPLELSGLELRGELASQRVSIERGGGAPVVIGKSLVRVMRLLPEQQQGDFLLTVEEIKGDGWPGGGLRARLRLDGQKLQSDGSVQLAQTPVLNFSATHGLGKGCGQGAVTLHQDMAVLGRGLQPAPVALRPLDLQSGVVSGSFRLDWCAQPTLVFDARGKLTGKGISLGWERARIEGLDFDAQLDALQPLQARVQLAAERGQLATGTALADFRVDLALSAKALQMNVLQLNLLGGSVHAGPHTLPWPLTDQTVPLEIREFDLGQLLALFKQPGLSGSGQLSGLLPLAYHDGALEVRDGRLNSLGSGTLKYAPALAIPDNPGLQVLRNLHFQKLGLEVGYASSGAYRAQLKLDGNNPDFYGGYPVRFNLNLNGELPGLFRAAIFSGDFNRHILEQLQSGKLE